MSQTTTPDQLDELLSDFFKSKLPHPWPDAPAVDEPRGLSPWSVENSTGINPVARRSSPTDHGRRARYTLAASVALLLGTCWLLTSGSQPADRPAAKPGTGGVDVLRNGTATMPEPLDKIREGKAKKTADPMVGFQPPKINLP